MIAELAPAVVAIEDVFSHQNVRSALALAQARGMALAVVGLAGLGWARYFAGSIDEALDSLEAAIQLTARSGRRQQFAMAILGRAAVELSRGQLAAADASAQQALGVLRAIGDATWTSAALAVGAEIERARGRLRTRAELAAAVSGHAPM